MQEAPHTSTDGAIRAVHLVELGGSGGIYHHTLAVGRALRDAGVAVVVHTAADAEVLDDGLDKCACLAWPRHLPRGVRQAVTAWRFVTGTVPHLVRAGQPGDIVHVQGLLGNQLTAWLIMRLRRRGRSIAFSPHNTFARSRRRIDDATIRWMARRAGIVITFSEDDQRRVGEWGAPVVLADLVHHIPTPSDAEIDEWNDRFASRPVALLAGQVRADKRPDVFVEACRIAEVSAAIVGPANDGEDLIRSGPDSDLIRVDGYLPLSSFVAAVTTCDVVVATHAVGSVSGPLSFARELGVRSVAPAIGGLAESVTVAADGLSASDFATAITTALSAPTPSAVDFEATAETHLGAYRMIEHAR